MEENEVWTATKRVMAALRPLSQEQAVSVLRSCLTTVEMSTAAEQR